MVYIWSLQVISAEDSLSFRTERVEIEMAKARVNVKSG